MIDRPSWDVYFLSLAFLIAQRSIDPNTKHGALAVDQENSIIATGYNSPPRGCDDSKIPLTRPEKYTYLLHAEEALICNAARFGISLRGAKLYISGPACSSCIRKIINAGFVSIVQGPRKSAMMDDFDKSATELMLSTQTIDIKDFTNKEVLCDLLSKTQKYIMS